MEKLPGNPFSTVVIYDATATQKVKIGKLASILGIKEQIEDRPMTKGEAGRKLRELYAQVRVKNKMKRR